MLTIDRIEIWEALSKKLKNLKKEEMKLRKEIINQVLGGEQTGKIKTEMCGYKLQAEIPMKLQLDTEVLKTIWPSLSQEEKNTIAFKPALQKRIYTALQSQMDCKNLDSAITAQPGSPTLKIL